VSNAALTWAWRQRAGKAKVVLVALADHANAAGECWPSVLRLVDETELSERTVQGHLVALEKAGLLDRVERPGKTTLYRLSVDRPPQKLRPDGFGTPAETAGPPRQKLRLTPAETAPEPSGNPLGTSLSEDRERVDLDQGAETAGRCGEGHLAGDPAPTGSEREAVPMGEQPDPVRRLVAAAGLADPAEQAAFIAWVTDAKKPRTIGLWHHAATTGQMPTWITEWRNSLSPPAPLRPQWCGTCDERTRLREDADGHPYRCPACHPLSAAA
jgi:DNA-binding transcriptional ArsR family regulator